MLSIALLFISAVLSPLTLGVKPVHNPAFLGVQPASTRLVVVANNPLLQTTYNPQQ